jgi:hypothetical protein
MSINRILLMSAAIIFMFAAVSSAQRRFDKKDRQIILEARVDPGFPSTPMTRIIFLPFANELDYQDGAMILSDNFINAMRQKHPEITIVSPQETRQIIQDRKLADAYRAFLGNYQNTGVATMPFLKSIGATGKVDGILLGRIHAFDVMKQASTFGGISWSKSKPIVGMELTLLRGKDGRELWTGVHGIQAEKKENVRDIAKLVCDIFATYFGRLRY